MPEAPGGRGGFSPTGEDNAQDLSRLAPDVGDAVDGAAAGEGAVPGMEKALDAVVVDSHLSGEDVDKLRVRSVGMQPDGTAGKDGQPGAEVQLPKGLFLFKEVLQLDFPRAAPHCPADFPAALSVKLSHKINLLYFCFEGEGMAFPLFCEGTASPKPLLGMPPLERPVFAWARVPLLLRGGCAFPKAAGILCALKRIPPYKFLVNLIEDAEFFQAPQGADEVFPLPVAGEALEDEPGRQQFQLVADGADVLLPAHEGEEPSFQLPGDGS